MIREGASKSFLPSLKDMIEIRREVIEVSELLQDYWDKIRSGGSNTIAYNLSKTQVKLLEDLGYTLTFMEGKPGKGYYHHVNIEGPHNREEIKDFERQVTFPCQESLTSTLKGYPKAGYDETGHRIKK